MNLMVKGLFSFVIILVLSGCSYVVQSRGEIPDDKVISIFALKNYTDTPRAGERASNILEGILLTKGYKVVSHVEKSTLSFEEMQKIAKEDDAKYFLHGGVSEWRYKTGIDGEPAVSLTCTLYKTKGAKVVWSATASDSDWGTSSIGTTAQRIFESMIR